MKTGYRLLCLFAALMLTPVSWGIGVPVLLDYGDAPDTGPGTGSGNYQTLAEDGGPSHTGGFPQLGVTPTDLETNAVPNAAATGDETTGATPDENQPVGMVPSALNNLMVGATPRVALLFQHTNATDVVIAGWIDFNGNGQFEASESSIVTNAAIAGIRRALLTFPPVPETVVPSTYARFRIGLPGDPAVLSPVGAAGAGEVEDYTVSIQVPEPPEPPETDFGDAPDPGPGTGSGNYRTLAADGGPSHVIPPDYTGDRSILGMAFDSEDDGIPGRFANGDDRDGLDDEDGVETNQLQNLQVGLSPQINVVLTRSGPDRAASVIAGWIDYNGNGDFEPEEMAISQQIGSGTSVRTLTFPPVPATAAPSVYARFRVGNHTDTNFVTRIPISGDYLANPYGTAGPGEVEDYPITIAGVSAPPVVRTRDIVVPLDANGQASITAAQLDDGSSSDCSGGVTLAISTSDFSCVDLGTNLVNLIVTDPCGESATGTAEVVIVDDLAPAISCGQLEVTLDFYNQAGITSDNVSAWIADNCQLQGFAINGTNSVSLGCADVGTNDLQITAWDASGNSTSCVATLVVHDQWSPRAVANDEVLYLNENGEVAVSALDLSSSSWDNCRIVRRELSFGGISTNEFLFNCLDIGSHQVPVQVWDGSGNTDTAVSIVTIVDRMAPILICTNLTLTGGGPHGPVTTNDLILALSDNCSSRMSLSMTHDGVLQNQPGANVVQVSADDNEGNSVACVSVVRVFEGRLELVQVSPEAASLAWESAPGLITVLERAESLQGPWEAIWTNPPPDAIEQILATDADADQRMVYRVVLAEEIE